MTHADATPSSTWAGETWRDGPDAVLAPREVVIDAGAIVHNIGTLRADVGEGAQIYAALKANAYGFGVIKVAGLVMDAGAAAVGVVDPIDAQRLRCSGFSAPILVYAGVPITPRLAAVAADQEITLSVSTRDEADVLGAAPRRLGVFMKVDGGLDRMGVSPNGASELALWIARHPRLELRGVYTHLHVPVADPSRLLPYVLAQFESFAAVLERLRAARVDVPTAMASSSGPLQLTSRFALDAIDPGQMIFGLKPPGPALRTLPLRPALRAVRTVISQVRTARNEAGDPGLLPPGARAARSVGVIPFGIAHGIGTASAAHVLVGGFRAPILNVSLEHARIDISDIGAQVGDEVVIVGRQRDEAITLGEVVNFRRLPLEASVPIGLGPSVRRVFEYDADA